MKYGDPYIAQICNIDYKKMKKLIGLISIYFIRKIKVYRTIIYYTIIYWTEILYSIKCTPSVPIYLSLKGCDTCIKEEY